MWQSTTDVLESCLLIMSSKHRQELSGTSCMSSHAGGFSASELQLDCNQETTSRVVPTPRRKSVQSLRSQLLVCPSLTQPKVCRGSSTSFSRATLPWKPPEMCLPASPASLATAFVPLPTEAYSGLLT